ncbi:type IV secretory system conjugative DNA transfer family protein [Corynebacterium variabile]|uniref:type IV secretory system conjugative DNA transfer family protein n=1 Tax=Corynebacterium variabile TaxID=1727 RepID=UPI003BB099BC
MAVNARGRKSPLSDPRIVLLLIAIGVWLIGTLAVIVTTAPEAPAMWPIGVIVGKTPWTVATTVVALVLLVLVTLAGIWLWRWRRSKDGGSKSVLAPYQVAARSMVNPRNLQHISEKDATRTGMKLTPALEGTPALPGVRMGTTLRGNLPVFADWESTVLVMAGPRMGKTQGIALPTILSAPGAVVTTSNKPDVFTDTWTYRATQGKVWLFDPQAVVDDPTLRTTMWWNPLRRVHDVPTSLELTGWLSAGAGNSADSNQTNKYFQDEGEKLLAALILASAVGGGDLKHVYDWLKDIQSAEPVILLRDGGFPDSAGDLEAVQGMDAKQRDGVIGFARQPVGLLAHTGFAQYVTPYQRVRFGIEDGMVTKDLQPGLHAEPLDEFVPAAFAGSQDTLYLLSMEGIGSAAGLVTALTGEVLKEATARANQQPNGRLPVPLVAVLDEAANVCKLGELPAQYSHFGSRGIIPITILQSPAQARRVWGPDGWDALKSSAAVKFYGGNCDDTEYLRDLSTKVGEHEVTYSSRSYGSGSASTSTSVQREPILEVSDLTAFPKEIALLQSPGNYPVLVRKAMLYDNTALKKHVEDTIARHHDESVREATA